MYRTDVLLKGGLQVGGKTTGGKVKDAAEGAVIVAAMRSSVVRLQLVQVGELLGATSAGNWTAQQTGRGALADH